MQHAWSESDKGVVRRSLLKLFSVFGVKDEARLGSYIEVLRSEAYCSQCIAHSVEGLTARANRFPTPAHILDGYTDAMASVHGNHVGPELTLDSGKDEGWWRTTGRKTIEQFVNDRDLALCIAANMWWNDTEPNEEVVEWELQQFGRTWIGAAANERVDVSRTMLVEPMLRRARRLHEVGFEGLTEEELNLGDVA